jgi:hypothetical protein
MLIQQGVELALLAELGLTSMSQGATMRLIAFRAARAHMPRPQETFILLTVSSVHLECMPMHKEEMQCVTPASSVRMLIRQAVTRHPTVSSVLSACMPMQQDGQLVMLAELVRT